jgi:hypothetical protein
MDNKVLHDQISQLSPEKQELFGLSCVDRILHLYHKFENEISTEQGGYFSVYKNGYNQLKNLLDDAFESRIKQPPFPKINYNALKEQCLKFAPDTDEISSNNAVIAQNCSIGLAYVYDFLLTSDVRNIFYCSDKVLETIDTIGFSKKSDGNFMKAAFLKEVQIEAECIEKIKSIQTPLQSSDITDLRLFNSTCRVQM